MIPGIELIEYIPPRQAEVGVLFAMGLNTTEIGHRMGYTPKNINGDGAKLRQHFVINETLEPRLAVALWFYENRDPLSQYVLSCKKDTRWQAMWEVCRRDLRQAQGRAT